MDSGGGDCYDAAMLLRSAAVAWAPVCLASCLLFEAPPPSTEDRNVSRWYELPAVQMSHEDLARKVREAIFRQGHQVLDLSPAPRSIVSEWNVMLRPYQEEGARTRLEVEIRPDGPGRHAVRMRSWRDYNANALNPISPEQARWRKGGLSELHVGLIDLPAERLFHSLKVSLLGFARD
jgi:hypothetical protein